MSGSVTDAVTVVCSGLTRSLRRRSTNGVIVIRWFCLERNHAQIMLIFSLRGVRCLYKLQVGMF